MNMKFTVISEHLNKKEILFRYPELKKYLSKTKNPLIEISPSLKSFVNDEGVIVYPVFQIRELIGIFKKYEKKSENIKDIENMFDIILENGKCLNFIEGNNTLN